MIQKKYNVNYRNMIHIILLTFILSFRFLPIQAQSPTIRMAEDALKTKKWRDAIVYATKLQEDLTLDSKIRSRAWLISARAHTQLHEFTDGLRAYLQAAQILEKNKSKAEMTEVYTEIGQIYLKNNMERVALEYFRKAQQNSKISPKSNLMLSERIADAHVQFNKPKNYQKALKIYDELKQTYLKQSNIPAFERVTRKVIKCHESTQNYLEAINQENELLQLYNKLKNIPSACLVHNNLGYYYQHLKKYGVAMKYFQQSLKIHRKYNIENYDEVATLVNMGVVYQNQGDYNKSLSYLLQALSITQQQGDLVQSSRISDLTALVYFYLGDYHNAHVYNEDAIRMGKASNQKEVLQESYKTASEIASGLEDYKKAMEYSRLYLAIRDSLLVEERLKQRELINLQSSIENTAKKTELFLADQEVRNLELQQVRIEAEKRKQENELLKEKEARILADQQQQLLRNEQTQLALQLARKQLDADRKNREIAELEKQKAQDDLVLKKQEFEARQKNQEINKLNQKRRFLEREKQLQNKTIAEQESKKRVLMGLMILAMLIILGMFWSRRQLRKKNKKIQLQSIEIEAQNKELQGRKNEIETQNEEMLQQQEEIIAQRDVLARTNDKLNSFNVELNKAYKDIRSSVQYAERIQIAMLPTLLSIQSVFPESFVLYKPRDIVSGDFYWFDTTGNKVVFAVADCTGHGVPGAFMSLIGNNLLDEIVLASKITKPNDILAKLHLGVVKVLKQTENLVRDGMDIALCCFDSSNNQLEFSGAKNPLVYVEAGQLVKIKGEVMPIGGSTKEGKRVYKTHSISIKPKTEYNFYMFSDGYQDQFGGPADRKFMSKRFRNLLLDIHDKPMETQYNILDQTIMDWMGEKEQIDDILVAGFRINV